MPEYYRFPVPKAVLVALLFCTNLCFSQSFDKAASNAFIITRFAEKFHIQPKKLNDTFSIDFYNQLLKRLDPEHLFFNKEDITQLSAYRLQLDNQVKQQKTGFLKLITSLYTKRLHQADTMLDAISTKHFNFSLQEKIARTEDESYPAGLTSMRIKLFKRMKLAVLNDLLKWNDKRQTQDSALLKQIPDSIVTAFQEHDHSVFTRDIKRILQSPGGIAQYTSDEYCKALASCYDPHTAFFPLTEKENFESMLGNQRFRFGFSIKEMDNGGVIIAKIEPGSPAFKCGLLNQGDQFQALQWQGQNAIDVSDAGVAELSAILSQSNHDQLIITVKKPDGSTRTVTLMKSETDADENNKVKSFLLKGNKTFGYISLPAFYNNWENEGNNGCANDVAKEILKLKRENISGLIIDLRYNGGGAIREAVELTGIFINAGPVAQVKTRMRDKAFTLKDVHRGTIYNGPLIILVNGYSASASELVAGSLQDYNRALIVGSSTYGKATGQVILPLDTTLSMNRNRQGQQAEDYLKITTSKLYRVTGKTAQFTGVKPDIVLPDFWEIHPQKEAGEPFALPSSNIASNKYYKPYAALPLSKLQAIAKKDADTMEYFIHLKKFIHEYKSMNTSADISLNWKKALAKEKNTPHLKLDTTAYTSNYSVRNNAYDLEYLKNNAAAADINTAFMNYLQQDPYIKIGYDLLIAMAK